MVKRLSVVNLENFRRQYIRRRWKVRTYMDTLKSSLYDSLHTSATEGHPIPVWSYFVILLFAFFKFCISFSQLSIRIVSLCNHLTRMMRKGHPKLSDRNEVKAQTIIIKT